MLTGGASLDLNVVQPKPCKWITDTTWLNLVELSNLHQFSGVLEQVTEHQDIFLGKIYCLMGVLLSHIITAHIYN